MRRLLPFFLIFVAGCSEPAGPDPKVEQARMQSAQMLRGLFDGAGGDYSKLTADQKAEFVKANGGDEAKAEAAWKVMKYGSAAAPKGTGAPK